MKTNKLIRWLIRFIKGILIGTGFILPGVSGGALAAIFGLYERIISFLAHLTRNFKKNILYLLPVAVGMLAGIVLLAHPLGFFLERFPAQTMWCFIGCILGTLPSLWKKSGQKGRRPGHIAILIVSAVAGFALLKLGEASMGGHIPLGFGTWLLAGVIIALGVLVPGLSPSNFLLYMGLYGPMTIAFQTLNPVVVLPIILGAAACMLALSRLFDWIFHKAYAGMFHFILGIVFASTAMIVPLGDVYGGLTWLFCIIACGAGIALGAWMSSLEKKYKHE